MSPLKQNLPMTDPSPAGPQRYRFGAAEFDESRFELRVGGRVVTVQPKPLRVLAVLLRQAGRTVSRDALYAAVWGESVTVEHVLASAVSKLRGALGAEGGAIVTVAREGYRLDAAVQHGAAAADVPGMPPLAAGLAVPGRPRHLLVRRLGRSERCETWLAEQPRTADRRVYKFARNAGQLAELKRELTLTRVLRKALGERPDMPRVLDASFDAPPFWIECEWGGDSLDQWAATTEGASSRLAGLSPAQRLEMALQIADALAAAHGAEVLHGDLKPANVLLQSAGGRLQVRLTDFGSGRLLDPAQIERLQLTRLGLTLDGRDASSGTPYYIAPELLAGAAPGPASDVFALGVVLFQLLAGDLRRPLAPGWEREIEDELLREDIALATDIDPARRLPGAAALAERLRRLPERRLERAAEAARAERERAQALERQNEALRALGRLLREDLVGAANPALQGRADITVAEALAGAAERVDTKYAALSDAVRGTLHAALQLALSELSRSQEAVQAGRRAVAALAPAAGSAQGPAAAELRQSLLEARLRLALDLVQLSRLDEAAEQAALIDAAAGPPSAQAPLFRARLLFVKSWVVSGDGSIEASLAPLQEAATLVEGMVDEPARGSILFALADNLVMLERHAEAEALYRRLLAEQVERQGDEHPRPNYTRVGLGVALVRQGRLAEAQPLLEQAAAHLAARLGPRHRQTLTALDTLAELRFRRHDWSGAATGWAEVRAGFAALLGEGSSYTLTVATNHAVALHRGGDAARAEPLLAQALQRARAFLAENAPQAQQIRFALADCRIDLGRAGEALPLLEGLDAQALNLAAPEPDWPARLRRLRERAGAVPAAS